jgi:FkbH-like protein
MSSPIPNTVVSCSTPAEYERVARDLRRTPDSRSLKLGVLASFSAQFLDSYLTVNSHRYGVPVIPWFGPFNLFEQLVLDPTAELWRSGPDVIWLAMRLEDVEPDLLAEFRQAGSETARRRIGRIIDRVVGLAGECRRRSGATLFVSNMSLPRLASADPFSASDPDGLKHIVHAANQRFASELAQVPDAWVLDYDGVASDVGTDRWEDTKLHYFARAGISSAGMAALAERFCRCLAAVKRPAVKCVVVDLDNTLWGGVVGDDGVAGIRIGHDYPGNVFRDVQVFLKGLRARGFLLAISSKNSEPVAMEAIRSHPDMVLRPSDFAATIINWEPKPANLRRIAEILNIGLDSLLFLDDNPVERARVRAELPQVVVPELPTDITRWLAALHRIELLDRPRLTTEDVRRAEMYAANSRRKELEQSAGGIGEFLNSLEMVAEVGLCDAQSLDRIHQLIQKTNQFNLTTRRHSIEDVRRLAADQGSAVAWLRLSDKCGDLGLVCVGILRDAGHAVWEIDTFLMSCRVMGRNVEDAFLAYLGEIARDRGGHALRGVFIPTAKNMPVTQFYPEHGFAAEASSAADPGETGVRVYIRQTDSQPLLWPAVIKRRGGSVCPTVP